MAIYSRKPFESLLAGSFAGLIMLQGENLITPFSEHLAKVMGNETSVWVVLVCGLMGGLIALLEMSGCLGSFSKWLQGTIKSERQSLVTTFLIGRAVFIDDYLNCLAVTIAMYYALGLLTFEHQMKAIFDGFKVMLYPLSTLIARFLLKEVNDSLGMTQYVISSIAPYMSREILPALVFIVMASVVFGTASSWGGFIIAIPIVVPIATGVDANIPLVIGALLSASSFGSHACFFSDSTVLAAQGAGCSPMAHAFTQIPYALLGAVITFGVFVLLGFTIA